MNSPNKFDSDKISVLLSHLEPGDRLKYIRKNLVKKNQIDFCSDKIIASSTLKAIESSAIKISKKASDKLIHKLCLEGIYCSDNIFSYEQDINLSIKTDDIIINKTEDLENKLSLFRLSLTKFLPILLDTDKYSHIFPNKSILFLKEIIKPNQLKNGMYLVDLDASLIFIAHNDNDDRYLIELNNADNSKKKVEVNSLHKIELIYSGS